MQDSGALPAALAARQTRLPRARCYARLKRDILRAHVSSGDLRRRLAQSGALLGGLACTRYGRARCGWCRCCSRWSALGVYDLLQTKHAIRRNFPVAGRLRYLFEAIRPEMQQYFVESNNSGRPFSRQERSLVYQRAKNVTDTLPFGTEEDVYAVGYEWMNHSLCANHPPAEDAARPHRRPSLPAPVRRRGPQRLGDELRRAQQERHLSAQSRRQNGRLLSQHR